MEPQPDFADALLGRLPPILKWCFAAMGGAAGWYYARTDASPIPLSYIMLGAVTGFFLLAALKAGFRLLKMLAIAGAFLLVVNYVFLIPFGYGNYLPGWIVMSKSAVRLLDPSRVIGKWGKDIELQPTRR